MRILLLLTLFLTACGFHLRGQEGMPFATLYLEAANPGTPFIAELRLKLEDYRVKLVNTPVQADLILNIKAELPEKQILTLGGSGRVNEFQLRYRITIRAYDQQLNDWIPSEEMMLRRDYVYDDTKILAKEAEEAMLYQGMRSDMIQQILRRLSRAKLQPL
jgi:LPS-assembly lipoprotein